MSKKGLIATLMLVAPWSNAAEVDSLNRCVSVVDHLERLQCYDSTMRDLQTNEGSTQTHISKKAAAFVATPLVATGNWTLKRDADDEENNVLALLKVDTNESSAPQGTTLRIKCREGKAELSIAWLAYIGRDVYVTSGEKGQKGKRENWRLTDNDTTSIYPFNTSDFINELYTMDYYLAQVQPVSDGALVANFNVTGLEETLRPHKVLCGF
ncbi:type VI secretion system-associated protein TagO [Agarivorans sp. MS3-6]